MIILGIETSCDDTAISVVEAKAVKAPVFKILSNVVSSQAELHQKYGGVYPSLAKREHEKNLPYVFKKAMSEANNPKIDAIAVTVGPGLEPCLWQGINFAQELSQRIKDPLIPINHIEAHILANFIRGSSESENLSPKFVFPAICLVVSGGHTQLILMKNVGKYKILGETRDDAAGECFDKTARILGLGYPGGPIISAKANEFKVLNKKPEIKLPRPMIAAKNYDFSFSGLKTAALYLVKRIKLEKKLNENIIQEICFEIQQSIIDVLVKKTIKAAKDQKAKSIILAGGVSANEELRDQFREKIKKEAPDVKYFTPDKNYCTDNAAMVAIAAFFQKKKRWKEIRANANLRIDKNL